MRIYVVMLAEVVLTYFVTLVRLLNLSGLCLYQKKVEWNALKTLFALWLNRPLNDAHCPVPHPPTPVNSTSFSDPQTSPYLCDLGQVI